MQRWARRLKIAVSTPAADARRNILENTELNSRATMYVNLAAVFLMGFFPEKWTFFTERDGFEIRPYAGSDTFEELYEAFLENVRSVLVAHINQRNSTERPGRPVQSHAAPLGIHRRLHIEYPRTLWRGARATATAASRWPGSARSFDSLYAVKEAVFERGMLSPRSAPHHARR